jgi:uncharacterized protein (DUF427 family)
VSIQVRELLASGFGELRYEPTAKRIRAVLGGDTVVDSTRALLVREPRRVVPSYAVPAQDVRGDLVPAGPAEPGLGEDAGVALPDVSTRPVLDPRVPFAVHSTDGEVTDLVTAGQERPGAGFCPADKDLASYFSVSIGGRLIPDIAWSYTDPRHDAVQVRDLIAFFGERIDVMLDGERRTRPVTPWS